MKGPAIGPSGGARLPWLGLLALVLLASSCAGPPEPPPPPPRPHVLLISLDTLRADRLGSHGYQRDTSPFLDQLAAGGTRFERAFVNTHGTPPSHATLFTSLYQRSHGVSLGVVEGQLDHHLPEALPILPQVLREAGYATVAVTGGGYMAEDFGWSRGFDAFADEDLEGAPGRLLKMIRKRLDGRPVFAFLHTYEIHSPYDPPEPYRSLWGPLPSAIEATSEHLRELTRRPGPVQLDDAELATLDQLYDAGIRYTDEVLRQLFERLEEIGFLEHALVVITSDHGEEFAEHGSLLHPATLYEELVAVPLILSGPGVPRGRVDPRLVSLLDVAPTIYGAAGVRPPRLASGLDLLEPGEAGPGQVFMQYGDFLHGVRTRHFKLVENRRKGEAVLYDLDRDPGETTDVAARRPGVVQELSRRLDAWRASTVRLDGLRSENGELSDERLEELRALGYVD